VGGNGRAIERAIIYGPLPSQRRFHELTSRFKGFSGPIGSGKSQALCQEAIRLSYINAGRIGLLGAPTYPMLRDITQATLFEILETNRIPFEHNKAENMIRMPDSGSRILFRPMEEYERLRGTNLAWFGVDELTYTQEPAWQRLEGRLRDPRANHLCGFGVWTPNGYDWVYRRFIRDRNENYEVVLAKPNENRYLLAKTPDFYLRLKGSYDERFYRQEVLGEYLAMDGSRVYWAFNRAEHVTKLAVDSNHALLWALDFNVDPMSSVVVQKIGERFYVVGEIVLKNATTQLACQEFLKRFPDHRAGVVIYGDAAGKHAQTSGASDYDIIAQVFRETSPVRPQYRVPAANPAVRSRVNLVNALLKSASGETYLFVDEKCKELIDDFEQVSYKADSNQIDKDRDRKRTHLSDALGYLLCEESRPRIGERSQPLLAG
jgi:hypothetical protein